MKRIEEIHLKPSELKHDFGNPRKITKQKLEELKKSFKKLGNHDIIKINEKNEIISGSQRIKALIEMGIDSPILCKKLIGYTESELKAINVQSNTHVGEWDYDILDNWEDDLKNWDFDDIFKDKKKDIYSKKIEAPIYEPKNEKPDIKDLYNNKKTNELIKEINKSDIKEDEKDFLIKAATRHYIFNYREIADFYAHSDKIVQDLMEKSALIIIDFNKAIEYGYVNLCEEIKKQYMKDYNINE